MKRLRFISDGPMQIKIANGLILVAALLAVVYIAFLILKPGESFVHPDFHDNILQEAMINGPSLRASDFLYSMQPRAAGEFRPRFLAYWIMTIDQKIRLILDRYVLVPATLAPLDWLLQIVVAPGLLFLLVVNLTRSRAAGLAAAVVYVSSIGFLCGIGMLLLQGKVLVNLVYIGVLYLGARMRRRSIGGGLLFFEIPGWEKYAVMAVILAGFFIDEMALFGIVLLPLFFIEMFWPRYLLLSHRVWPDMLRVLRNGLFYALPGFAFLVIVLVVMPAIWRRHFGIDFDYLGNTLAIGENSRGAQSIFSGPNGVFGLVQIYENVTTLFGMSLVPEQISSFVRSPFGSYPGTQVMNAPKAAILVFAFGCLGWMSWSARDRAGTFLRRTLVATGLFMIFLCLVMIRQFPVVTGYYYGAPFATMFALLAGLAFVIAAKAPAGRLIASAVILWVSAVQIGNFTSIQSGWRYTHDELVTRPRYEKRLKLSDRQVTESELSNIWSAWRSGELTQYLAEHEVSTGAVYLVVELQTIDRRAAEESRP